MGTRSERIAPPSRVLRASSAKFTKICSIYPLCGVVQRETPTNKEKRMMSRKPNRLKNYDYSQNGVYFVTICTQNREELFGKIIQTSADDFVGAIASIARKTTTNQPYVKLTKLGECVDETIHIANNNNDVKIDKYIIMPDHIHLIVVICSKTGDTFGDFQFERRSPLAKRTP
jgi:REP element-mobilizing transposase RayT